MYNWKELAHAFIYIHIRTYTHISYSHMYCYPSSSIVKLDSSFYRTCLSISFSISGNLHMCIYVNFCKSRIRIIGVNFYVPEKNSSSLTPTKMQWTSDWTIRKLSEATLLFTKSIHLFLCTLFLVRSWWQTSQVLSR